MDALNGPWKMVVPKTRMQLADLAACCIQYSTRLLNLSEASFAKDPLAVSIHLDDILDWYKGAAGWAQFTP